MPNGVLAIRISFYLVDMMTNTKFSIVETVKKNFDVEISEIKVSLQRGIKYNWAFLSKIFIYSMSELQLTYLRWCWAMSD